MSNPLSIPEKNVKSSSTYITGHCGNGGCEGTNRLSTGGALMPTCRGRYEWRGKVMTCQHECHVLFRKMRELVSELEPTDSSSSNAVEWPSFTSQPTSARIGLDVGTAVSGPLTAPIRAVSTAPLATVTLTPSGRRPKGALEEQVRAYLAVLCSTDAGKFIVETYGVTPIMICKAVDPEDLPSQGAVYAVLLNWSKKNLVTLEKKPFRFKGFTPQGERQLKF